MKRNRDIFYSFLRQNFAILNLNECVKRDTSVDSEKWTNNLPYLGNSAIQDKN